jgi:hypothetical protein
MPIQDAEGHDTKRPTTHQSAPLHRTSVSLQRASMDVDPDPLPPSAQADGMPALHTHRSSRTAGITQKHLWLVIIASIGIIVVGAGIIIISPTFSSSSTTHRSSNSSSQPRASLGIDGKRSSIRPPTPIPTIHPPTPTFTPVPIIGTQYVAAATAAPGISTGITIPLHATVDLSTYGIASFVSATNADCAHASYTDPDGNLYYETTKAHLCGKGPLGSTATMPSVPIGTLIGRIGTGPWMVIGIHKTFTAQTTGTLYLLYNDSLWNDNTGGYNVNLHIQP